VEQTSLYVVFNVCCFVCCQYVNMLKQDGPKEWIFQEYKDIVSMHFRFKDKESPRSYVSNTVHNLHVSQNFHIMLLS
jgi:secreted Zn-dependent insulinase-like peptidase